MSLRPPSGSPTGVILLAMAWALFCTACNVDVAPDPEAGDATETPCEPGDDSACDDGDSCTVDQCLPTKSCAHAPRVGVCHIDGDCYADGAASALNLCKVCDVARDPLDWSDRVCSDDTPCTVDDCDADEGCVYEPDDAAACDDGDPCSTDDHCAAGVCTGTCPCNVDSDCTAETAGPCEKTVCAAHVCSVTSDLAKNGQPCDAGDPCREGTVCEAGSCVGGTLRDCSELDEGECLAGSCDPASGACVQGPRDDGSACDDADPCTTGDACAGGVCAGIAVDCSDLAGPCTLASCADGACVQTARGTGESCEPTNPCIKEAVCDAQGVCAGDWDTDACPCDTDGDCDDGQPCTQDLCEPVSHACAFQVFEGACFLGGACYFDSQQSSTNHCLLCDAELSKTTWSERTCNDGNPCTKDACDPATGCTVENVDGGPCKDADPCTQGEVCYEGTCVGLCECKLDAHCLEIELEVPPGPCETVACLGYKCKVVADPEQDGAPCDDGDACTQGDVCVDGQCAAGLPVTCPSGDGSGCSTSACDPAAGGCAITSKEVGAPCDDGDPCTVADACGPDGLCVGPPKSCAAFVSTCHSAECVAGTCVQSTIEGGMCDDGNSCTIGDQCDASGKCIGSWVPGLTGCTCGSDADCDDTLACTIDTCLGDQSCSHTVKPGYCLIDSACHANGTLNPANLCQLCKAGVSKGSWQAADCDDGNPCTDDDCAPGKGCAPVADDSNACNDGDPCTQDDHCQAGACTGTCQCLEDADCGGVVAPCKRWACQGFACVQVGDTSKDGTSCDDGKYCSVGDKCQAGQCKAGTPRDCSAAGDGKCTVGACDEGGDACLAQAKLDGDACDDGDACTEGDTCVGGICQGEPLDCSAFEDQCHIAHCSAGHCKSDPTVSAACDDADPCTLSDACTPDGKCVGTWDTAKCGCTSDAICAGLTDACNTGRCDPATGKCYAEPLEGQSCDDGEPCTWGDVCHATGAMATCSGVTSFCSDGKECTQDICDGFGGCLFAIKAGRCYIGGICYNEGQTNPTNPCQRCESGLSWKSNDGGSCDDGQPQTTDDVCLGGKCVGTPYTCPHLDCETVSYDGKGGCVVAPAAGSCVIAGDCRAANDVHPTNPCLSCLPSVSQTSWSNNNTSCVDPTNPCTKDGICTGGKCQTTPYSCSDGLGCTQDACDGKGGCIFVVSPGRCLIDGVCWTTGDAKPGQPCLACLAGKPQAWSPLGLGIVCDDGLSCTSGDTCNGAGLCTGSVAGCAALECEKPTCTPTGGCDVELKPGWCRIDGACYLDGASPTGDPCRVCDAGLDVAAWSHTTSACDDGDSCTASDACAAGTCKGAAYGCDDGLACTSHTCDGAGGCSTALLAGYCLVGGVCRTSGSTNPASACQVCDPVGGSPTSWTNLANGAKCTGDGLACTDDRCEAGVCVHPTDEGFDGCLIDGACWEPWASNPANECQMCHPYSSLTSWFAMPAGTSCTDDGIACTTDVCQDGLCVHAPEYPLCGPGAYCITGSFQVSYVSVLGGDDLATGIFEPWMGQTIDFGLAFDVVEEIEESTWAAMVAAAIDPEATCWLCKMRLLVTGPVTVRLAGDDAALLDQVATAVSGQSAEIVLVRETLTNKVTLTMPILGGSLPGSEETFSLAPGVATTSLGKNSGGFPVWSSGATVVFTQPWVRRYSGAGAETMTDVARGPGQSGLVVDECVIDP